MAWLGFVRNIAYIILMLVAACVLFLAGASMPFVLYSIISAILVGIANWAWGLRRSVDDIIKQKSGELRSSHTEGQGSDFGAYKVEKAMQPAKDVPSAPVQVTENFVPYDKAAMHQQYISHALLILDTFVTDGKCSREYMTPGKISQDDWAIGMEWLIGAGIVHRKNNRSATWNTLNRDTAKGMLQLYSKRVTSATIKEK